MCTPKKPAYKQATLLKVGECLYRNQSSGTYYALVKKSGKQIRRSLKTQDRKLAERRLRDFRRDVGKLSDSKEIRRQSFEEFTEWWFPLATSEQKVSSSLRVRRCVEELNRRFGSIPIANVTRDDCETWAAERGRKIAASTYNQDIQTLKGIFKMAVERGILLDNPADGIKRRKVVNKSVLIPSQSQFETLIETMEYLKGKDARSRHSIDLVKLLAFSGMRLGEATRIIWDEIDFENKRFTVSGGKIGTKNGETRIVPLFPQLAAFLMGFGIKKGFFEKVSKEIKDKTLIYFSVEIPKRNKNVSKNKKSNSKKVISNSEIKNERIHLIGTEDFDPQETLISIDSGKKALIAACKEAGLPNFTHHCLRHYFVSNAIERNIPFHVIASWVGHKDGGLLVAKTYGHLRDTHSAEMAKLMGW